MIADALLWELDSLKIPYEKGYCLKGACTFRIGGVTPLAVFPKSEEQLMQSVCLLDRHGVECHVVGRGSNTLFSDGELKCAIIFTRDVDAVRINGTTVDCGAGVGLMTLASLMCRSALTGLEFACGIPGSVGGALFMNAGAHGGAMENVVSQSRAYNRKSGEIEIVTDHSFGYRKSIYMIRPELVCLGATLKLEGGCEDDIRARMRSLLETRREKQPLEFPSAGSYFKRPEGDFAGRLIEVCGLKGARVGDAQVSEKHAGFIINRGNADFNDVMELETLVRHTVLERTGVLLQREVEIVK